MANLATWKIPKGWKETTLGEVASKIFSGGTPNTQIKEYWGGDLNWLSSGETGQKFIYDTEKKITKRGSEESSTRFADKNSVVIATAGQGNTRGQTSLLKVGSFINQSIIAIDCDRKIADNVWLFYNLLNRYSELRFISESNSIRGSLTTAILGKLSLLLPSLSEQQKIAAVLSSLDNKIELLQGQNKTLEATAQAIFDEWFVKPSRNKKLPKGWHVGKLSDEFEILMGQSPEGESFNEAGKGMFFFQGRTDFGFRFPSIRLYTTNPKRIAEKFDVLVSVRAPVGDINMAFDKCCIGRGVAAVKSKFKSYAYYKIKTLRTKFEDFENSGTIFGSMNKDDFNRIEVSIPDKDSVDKFDNLAKPIDEKIYSNSVQLETLSKLREAIRPKLIRGEVRVKEFSE